MPVTAGLLILGELHARLPAAVPSNSPSAAWGRLVAGPGDPGRSPGSHSLPSCPFYLSLISVFKRRSSPCPCSPMSTALRHVLPPPAAGPQHGWVPLRERPRGGGASTALGKAHSIAWAKAKHPQSRDCQMDIALGDFGEQLQTWKCFRHLQNLTSNLVSRNGFIHFSGSARSILKDLPSTFASPVPAHRDVRAHWVPETLWGRAVSRPNPSFWRGH